MQLFLCESKRNKKECSIGYGQNVHITKHEQQLTGAKISRYKFVNYLIITHVRLWGVYAAYYWRKKYQ